MLYGQTECLDLYVRSCNRSDLWLKMILAIVSSVSIGAWAVWKQYPLIWAGIIAASQVVAAVNPLLPFKKRRKAVNELASQLRLQFVEWEAAFNQIREGDFTGRYNQKLWMGQ